MSYLINPIREDRCVLLSYEGRMPALEVSAARYEASGMLKRLNWSRIVVDLSALQPGPKPVELRDFALGFLSVVPPDARVAVVVRPEQARSAARTEEVARRQGVLLLSFVDSRQALHWVKRTSSRRPPVTHARHCGSSLCMKSVAPAEEQAGRQVATATQRLRLEVDILRPVRFNQPILTTSI